MAKRSRNINAETLKSWREGELIDTFNLNRIITSQTPLMQEWLDVGMPILNVGEQYMFDKDLLKAQKNIVGWSEEDLKIKFISTILELGHLTEDDIVMSYFDKIISATVESINLTVKSDFMLAKGTLNVFKMSYFHFQEYKPQLNPSGEPMAQLLQAFLIAQEKNQHTKPLYGAEVIGANWRFVTMEGKDYCISKTFDSVDNTDLKTIIAVLRKFRHILETKLIG